MTKYKLYCDHCGSVIYADRLNKRYCDTCRKIVNSQSALSWYYKQKEEVEMLNGTY